MHYMLVNQLHSHYIQHVMYVITYPLHAFEDANELPGRAPVRQQLEGDGGVNRIRRIVQVGCIHLIMMECTSRM